MFKNAFVGLLCILGVFVCPRANYGLTTQYKLVFEWSFDANPDGMTAYEFFVKTDGVPTLIGTIPDITVKQATIVADIPSGRHQFCMRATSDDRSSEYSPDFPFELVTNVNGFRHLSSY